MKKTILISILLSLLPVFAIAAGHKSDEGCHHKHSDQKHESSYHDDEEDNKDSDEPKKREYRSSYY